MASSALPGIYIITSRNEVNVEMLGKTRADVHVTSLLRDLLLSVLLYSRNRSTSNKEKKQMIGDRQQLQLQQKRKQQQKQKKKQ